MSVKHLDLGDGASTLSTTAVPRLHRPGASPRDAARASIVVHSWFVLLLPMCGCWTCRASAGVLNGLFSPAVRLLRRKSAVQSVSHTHSGQLRGNIPNVSHNEHNANLTPFCKANK